MYAVPDNCPALEVSKVNTTVWENLRPSTRARDARIQRVQRVLASGITAVGRTITGDITDTQNDALALLANAQYELIALRKELMRPDINPKLAHLIKSTTHCTGQLFGGDLSKQIKDLQEEQKVSAGVGRPGTSKFNQGRDRPEYRPYPSPANRNRDRFRKAGWTSSQQGQRPFLGEGQAHTQRWNQRGGTKPPAQRRPPPPSKDQGPGPGKRFRKSH